MKASVGLVCLVAYLMAFHSMAMAANLAACLGDEEMTKIRSCLPDIEKCQSSREMFECLSIKTCLNDEGIDDHRLIHCALEFINDN